MSTYSPPVGNAVNFKISQSYTPPSGNVVNFNMINAAPKTNINVIVITG